ncbi:MAG TPA: glycosyltransferase [Bryobacteraceae bacterium]|nr:glycosyltransferase [Bryobacteraceae bacterium]
MPWPVLLMARELDLGGSERQLALLARALDSSKFEPIVGCFRPEGLRGRELQDAGIPIRHFPVDSFASRQSLSGAWQLARFIRQRGIRLVHTFDYPLTVFAVPVTKLFTDALPVSSQRAHRDLIPPPYRTLIRFTDRLASAIVVNCDFVRRHLEQDEGVPASRIQLCSNGLDLDQFHPSAAPRPSALPPDGVVIGVVCALRREKGLADLLQAVARLRMRPPATVTLAIVGSGPMRENLQSMARDIGLADRCLFIPATDEIPRWLGAIDIFVLPSRSEAFSNSLMEAMACGCCVVASAVGGNPELVRHGETGMLFPPGDIESLAATLDLLLKYDALRRQFAQAGSQWVRDRFSIQTAAQRMSEIYADLIERRARAGPPPRAASR